MPNQLNKKLPLILRTILESKRPLQTHHLLVRGPFLWISDFEVPFHNAKFLNDVITLARRFGIKICVWGGDAFHFEAFSPFPGADRDADKELSEIDEFLPGFLEPFDKIYYIMGNHDDRVQRSFKEAKISMKHALRMVLSPDTLQEFYGKVEMSDKYWMRAEGGWQLEHQKNNSKQPTKVAQELGLKEAKHIITGHTHKWGQVLLNGRWAIDSGCGVDIRRLNYINQRHSTHTAMENGAVLMRQYEGEYMPLLVNPRTIRYELELAKNLPS